MKNPFSRPITALDVVLVIFYAMVFIAIYKLVTYNPL